MLALNINSPLDGQTVVFVPTQTLWVGIPLESKHVKASVNHRVTTMIKPQSCKMEEQKLVVEDTVQEGTLVVVGNLALVDSLQVDLEGILVVEGNFVVVVVGDSFAEVVVMML
jgi:hypothetical protein